MVTCHAGLEPPLPVHKNNVKIKIHFMKDIKPTKYVNHVRIVLTPVANVGLKLNYSHINCTKFGFI